MHKGFPEVKSTVIIHQGIKIKSHKVDNAYVTLNQQNIELS